MTKLKGGRLRRMMKKKEAFVRMIAVVKWQSKTVLVTFPWGPRFILKLDAILRFALCVEILAISVDIVQTILKFLHQNLNKPKLIKIRISRLKLKKFPQQRN